MKIPKNHKAMRQEFYEYLLEGPLDDVIKNLRTLAKEFDGLEPHLYLNIMDNQACPILEGYRPMTDIEKKQARLMAESRRKARAEAIKENRDAEIKELKKLAEKYPEVLKKD